jgi:ATP synthase protein I
MTAEVRIVRGAALATVLSAPLVAGVAWLVAGRSGAVGALLGSLLAVAFFAVTVVAVGAAARVSDELMLPAALGTYLLKVVGLGLLFVTLGDTTAFDRSAFAISTVVGTCVFLGAELRLAARARIPAVVVRDDVVIRDDEQ